MSHGMMKYLGSTRGVVMRDAVVARSQMRRKLVRAPGAASGGGGGGGGEEEEDCAL